MSFASMKSSRANELAKLKSAMEAGDSNKPRGAAEEFWKPERDKAGNGQAIIRFLPAADGEDNPWIQYYDHFFKGPTGQYYVEKSLTTLGQNDPVSEFNSTLWNSGVEEDKETARAQKRRLHYVANILVVKDFANPENNGRVMPYRFGRKIWDKIKDAMNPAFEGDEPVNPFDFWEGADFHIKITNVGGWANYDKSIFKAPTQLFDGDDAQLEAVYNKLTPLSNMIAADQFKSYDELKAKLNRVLCIESDEPTLAARPPRVERPAPVVQEEVEVEVRESAPAPRPAPAASMDDDDDTLSYFQSLAED